MPRKASSNPADSTANLGFEAKLWLAVDTMRTSPAWVQDFIHHLAPHGMAGFVLANGPALAGSPTRPAKELLSPLWERKRVPSRTR